MEGGEGIGKDTSRFLCQKRKRLLRRDLGMRDIKSEEHWEETKSLASGHCRRFRGSFTGELALLACLDQSPRSNTFTAWMKRIPDGKHL
jgi:hypothetical protein